jgi:hypothetical protein
MVGGASRETWGQTINELLGGGDGKSDIFIGDRPYRHGMTVGQTTLLLETIPKPLCGSTWKVSKGSFPGQR